MKKLLIVLAALALSGCTVIPNKAGYGSPIEEVIEKYGPNYKMTEKKNGRRAYEWTVTETIDHPGGITFGKSKTERNKHGWDVTTSSSVTIGTKGYTSTNTCRYKYNTRFKPKRSAWIVTSIVTSGSGC